MIQEHGNRESTNAEHGPGDSECSRRKPLWADLFDLVAVAAALVAENFPQETESSTAGEEETADRCTLTLADVGFVAVARFATGAIRSPIMPGFHTGRMRGAPLFDGTLRSKRVHGLVTTSSVL